MRPRFDKELIAPCGMYCGVCSHYLASAHGILKKPRMIMHCPGCRQGGKTCSYLKGWCSHLREGKYCFECNEFPCHRLKMIDKRYRTKYAIALSFIENLGVIGTKARRLSSECSENDSRASAAAGFCRYTAGNVLRAIR